MLTDYYVQCTRSSGSDRTAIRSKVFTAQGAERLLESDESCPCNPLILSETAMVLIQTCARCVEPPPAASRCRWIYPQPILPLYCHLKRNSLGYAGNRHHHVRTSLLDHTQIDQNSYFPRPRSGAPTVVACTDPDDVQDPLCNL